MPAAGDFLTADLASERALVVRDEKGVLHAFRNACRRRPHALVSVRKGHFTGSIPCAAHGLTYRLDGRQIDGDTAGDLTPLEVEHRAGLIFVRAPGANRASTPPPTGWEGFAALAPASIQETEVAADWKLLVEQWLEASLPLDGPDSVGGSQPRHGWRARARFLPPNQLVEMGPGSAFILRVLPEAPGRSRLQRLDFSTAVQKGRKPATQSPAGHRRVGTWLAQQIELAESTQIGLAAAGNEVIENGPVSLALAQFRGSIAELLPHAGLDL
jgi:nitrite reductase/ring-hydroxylating ferredoxin subunit